MQYLNAGPPYTSNLNNEEDNKGKEEKLLFLKNNLYPSCNMLDKYYVNKSIIKTYPSQEI